MKELLLIFLLTLFLSFIPFIQKNMLQKYSIIELRVIISIIYTFILPFFIFYLYKKNCLNCFKKITKEDIMLMIFIVIVGTIAGITFSKLLKENNISYIIPFTEPLTLIFTIFIGYYMYNEKISIIQGIGIFLIILGIILLNNNRKK